MSAQDFIRRVEDKTSTVGVIGMGYVGLPLAMAFERLGFPIVGVDNSPARVERLMGGHSDMNHIPDARVAEMVERGRFTATTDFAALMEADSILICVPTPLGPHREPDLSYVEATCRDIAKVLQKGQIVILESTTWPGTSQEVMVPLLEEGSGFTVNEDFHIAYSPEREDPGNPNFETSTIPKVVGADTKDALDMACSLYGAMIDEVVPVSSLKAAEAVKLTENIFRSVNIALVNELKVVYEKMGVDVWEVINAAATKPFGFMPFYPGPGLGGHCIPIDPFYLTWKAQEYGQRTRFIELAGEINTAMPLHVVDRMQEALNRRASKAMNGARILLVGLAYKKNINDMRESPAFVLLEEMEKLGASVDYYDPYVPVITPTREHAALTGRKSVTWSLEHFANYDAALICTDHDNVDYAALVEALPFTLDTRNATKNLGDDLTAKVEKA
ncbi:MAG: nucleotide sugar dehydrogenase [Pseudomonadota bacterium]